MSSRASVAQDSKQQQHLKAKNSSEFSLEDSDYDSDAMVDSNSLEDGRLLRPLHIETRSFPQLSSPTRPPSWLRQYGWISLNVAAWFAATALAARAMQAWSHHVLEEWSEDGHMEWMDRVALATTVTAIQLLLGGLLGQAALALVQWYSIAPSSISSTSGTMSSPTSGLSLASGGWETKRPPQSPAASAAATSPTPLAPWITLGRDYSLGPVQVLGVLHALGSLGANYGYMVGDGAHTPVVQMIRLLEPFETMIWTQAFLPSSDEAHILSGSLLSAVLLTSGGAISLLDRKSPATADTVFRHPLAFALASGLCHSSRIVLQRLHNQTLNNNANNTTNPPNSNTNKQTSPNKVSSPTGSLLSSFLLVQKVPPTRKLERILWQFRQLSFESGKWTVAASLGVHLYKLLHHQSWSLEHLGAVLSWHSIPLWTWHPLFNLCSMMTLGYCAALTHSILTVCRRTFTVLWEGTITDDLAGGVLVLWGAAWYLSLVMQQSQQSSQPPRSTSTWVNWLKVVQPMVVLVILQVVYSTQTYTFHNHASFGEGGI